MCETHGSLWALNQAFLMHILYNKLFFSSGFQSTAETQRWNPTIYEDSHFGFSHSSAPIGSLWADIRGLRTNRVGDVRPHSQGVEGIGFPWLPHLSPTEAREQCEQCSLRVPVGLTSLIQSVIVILWLFVHWVVHIVYTQPLLFLRFYALFQLPFFLSWSPLSFSFSLARHYHMQG